MLPPAVVGVAVTASVADGGGNGATGASGLAGCSGPSAIGVVLAQPIRNSDAVRKLVIVFMSNPVQVREISGARAGRPSAQQRTHAHGFGTRENWMAIRS